MKSCTLLLISCLLDFYLKDTRAFFPFQPRKLNGRRVKYETELTCT